MSLSLYLPELYTAEHELSWFLSRILKKKLDNIPPKIDGLLHLQPNAVRNACESKVSILTGPPGTGKTTTLEKIVQSFEDCGLSGAIACPTGKARKRADEVINKNRPSFKKIDCFTCHTLLRYMPFSNTFEFNRTNFLQYDYIIIDEFSMADTLLARDLIEAINPNRTRIVFCGDPHQLPSVGPGNVSRDLINCGVIPTIELDTVLRTGPDSGITYNASRILRGQQIVKTNLETGEKFTDTFFFNKDPDEVQSAIIKMCTEILPDKKKFDPIKDIQLLCPGKKGAIGTVELNKKLRELLNPRNSQEIMGFKIGDKVINTKNNKRLNISNGDIGTVVDCSGTSKRPSLHVDFSYSEDEKIVVSLGYEEIRKLQHAYASTVHRSQGSEYTCGIMPVYRTHYTLINRNLIYTGYTRSKKLSIIYGDEKMLSIGIKNSSSQKRNTRLKELIIKEFKKKKQNV